jgi:hypothetical protein
MAPIIATLLGKGLNLVANAVAAKGKDWVENKLGVELKPDMTSEDYAKLQIAQMQHEEELLKLKLEDNKLDLQELDLRLKDTDSARKRETEIATSEKAPLINKIVTPVLALGVTAITFVLFGFLMFDSSPVEPSRKDVLVYVLGALTAISTQVISYYFGSSVGSKDKSAQLDKVLK